VTKSRPILLRSRVADERGGRQALTCRLPVSLWPGRAAPGDLSGIERMWFGSGTPASCTSAAVVKAVGGVAIRALAQYRNRPVYITSDTFRGGRCSNGGALSSIDVNWDVINSVMTGNRAIGCGANPASPGPWAAAALATPMATTTTSSSRAPSPPQHRP
jgi:hypothetical protein